MSTTTICAAEKTGTDKLDALLKAARNLRPTLLEHAASTEAEGRVGPEITCKLVETGLHRTNQPAKFGGAQLPPSALVRIGFELARGCMSTSWCSMLSNGMAWIAAFWPEAAQEDIWGSDNKKLVCGVTLPTGICSEADGGYMLHGSWAYASNCDNADWFSVSAPMPDTPGVIGGFGWFLVPREQMRIDHDSWKVIGMKGTGSKTVWIDDPVFVPAHRVIRFQDILNNSVPGLAIEGNEMALYNFATFGATQLIGPVVGGAQAALDWFCEAMKTKIKKGYLATGATISENAEAQVIAGEAQTRIDAAMALLLAALEPAEARLLAGHTLTEEERLRVRRSVGFAAREGREVTNLIYRASGSAAGREGSPVERIWRDVNFAANHATFDTFGIYRMGGQFMFGLNPEGYR